MERVERKGIDMAFFLNSLGENVWPSKKIYNCKVGMNISTNKIMIKNNTKKIKYFTNMQFIGRLNIKSFVWEI